MSRECSSLDDGEICISIAIILKFILAIVQQYNYNELEV